MYDYESKSFASHDKYLGGSKSPVTCDFFCMKVNSILQCVNFIKYYIQNAKSVILALVANIKKSNNYT